MRKLGAAIAAGTAALIVAGWFYRPSTSAEWAAWVQTLGVLAAILWAVRLQMTVSKQGERQAAQVAAMFANNMHWVFRELNDACGKCSWDDYTVHRRILREVLAQGREVTLQLLDGRSLAMVTSLRSIAVVGVSTNPQSFGQDSSCELYVTNGNVLDKIVSTAPPSVTPACPAAANATAAPAAKCKKRHHKKKKHHAVVAKKHKKHKKHRCKKKRRKKHHR